MVRLSFDRELLFSTLLPAGQGCHSGSLSVSLALLGLVRSLAKCVQTHYRVCPAAGGSFLRFPWGNEDSSLVLYWVLILESGGEIETPILLPRLTSAERLTLASLKRSGFFGPYLPLIASFCWPVQLKSFARHNNSLIEVKVPLWWAFSDHFLWAGGYLARTDITEKVCGMEALFAELHEATRRGDFTLPP